MNTELQNIPNDSENEKNGRDVLSRCKTCFNYLFLTGSDKTVDLTLPHVLYFVLFTISTFCSAAVFFHGVKYKLEGEPYLCEDMNIFETCDSLVPYLIIYKVGFTFALFFTLLLIVTAVSSFKRSLSLGLHVGAWFYKLFVFCLLGIGAFFIPRNVFGSIWTYLGLSASFIFLLSMTVSLIDLSNSLNKFFSIRINTSSNGKLWEVPFLCLVVLFYIISLVLLVVLFLLFSSGNACQSAVLLICCNAFLCIIATGISAKCKRDLHHTHLLQAAIFSAYTMFLTYCALAYQGEQCGLVSGETVLQSFKPSVSVQAVVNLLLMYIILVYVCLRAPSPAHLRYGNYFIANGRELVMELHRKEKSLTGSSTKDKDIIERLEVRRQKVDKIVDGEYLDMEKNEITNHEIYQITTIYYNPMLFHSLFCCSSLFQMMTFTQWFGPIDYSVDFFAEVNSSWVALYIRTVCSITPIVLYIWCNIAPTVYPDRDNRLLPILLYSFVEFLVKSLYAGCFRKCPLHTNSKLSRAAYTFLLLSGSIASCVIMFSGKVRHILDTSPYFCERITKLGMCVSMDPAILAVYRICFSMAAFFLLFALILVSVKSRSDPRDTIHNGIWCIKFLLFFAMLLGTFFVPGDMSKHWMYIGLMGTFFFVIIQSFLLMDVTFISYCKLFQKSRQDHPWCYRSLIVVLTFLFILSIIAVTCFYTFFASNPRCKTNRLFISINVILCTAASIISMHKNAPRPAILQAAAVTTFSMYLTWSALSYNPDERCNPLAEFITDIDIRTKLNIHAIVDCFLMLLTVIYFSIRVPILTKIYQSATAKKFHYILVVYDLMYSKNESDEDDETTPPTSPENNITEEDSIPYSYCLFHMVYFAASLYVTLVLTNWFTPQNGSQLKMSFNWAAMCIKMTTSCLCVVIYLWCLVTPILTKTCAERYK